MKKLTSATVIALVAVAVLLVVQITNSDFKKEVSLSQQLEIKREKLIQFIWGDKGFPYSKLPDKVDYSISDEKYSTLANISSIDRIIVVMDYGFDSVAHHFRPVHSNKKLVIYHEGHKRDFNSGFETIKFFLDHNYSVVAFSMPLTGMNNRPVVPFDVTDGSLKLYLLSEEWVDSGSSIVTDVLLSVSCPLTYENSKVDRCYVRSYAPTRVSSAIDIEAGTSAIVYNGNSGGKLNFEIVGQYLPYQFKTRIISHDDLGHLKFSDNSSAIKFFVEPVAVVFNYMEKYYNYDSVSMVGISGGGWTTVLYSAIDTRIPRSYPVAGSLPLNLRFQDVAADWGDWEQILPELYSIANYTDLYIMGSYGDGRKQLQILNYYDPCCFGGDRYKLYEGYVKEMVAKLGKGTFEVFSDDSHHDHKISNLALTEILNDLNN